PPTPQADCAPGSRPEPGMQGRVPAEAVASGAADAGYSCNAKQVGHEGLTGGFKVYRYVDKAGRECAYYDTTLLFPLNAQNLGDQPTGVAVLDLSDPANPVRTTTLVTPAMQSPHESLNLNVKRGLLAAVLGNPDAAPGVVDVYDVSEDCRSPVLQASAPAAFLGHESGFPPDGRTFYATSLFDGHVTAVDLTNPRVPTPITVFENFSHGMNVSDDGTRGYMAARNSGLEIVDLSEIQERRPLPRVREVGRVTWDTMSIPQNAIPITIGGRPYVMEVDEFSVPAEGGVFPAENGPRVGAARLIDVSDETRPRQVSEMRLEVHQPENRAQLEDDPGATSFVQGYAGHYCNVPRRRDPGIVACSFILSGLRVFDIRDPERPREIAYFVAPPRPSPGESTRSNYAMSSPEIIPERGEIWYSDGNSGFYVVRLDRSVYPFRDDCLRPARIAFKLHRRGRNRVVRVEAFVGGKRRLVSRGRDLRRVELNGLPRTGRMKIRIVATHNTGSRVVSTRSWNGCTKGKPKVRRIAGR
ncbi:MAG: hypothetical protein M3340_15875, partial [Actinomycetota bacterium]|nr:hypothetical protein [Actinomycetota bacterium]